VPGLRRIADPPLLSAVLARCYPLFFPLLFCCFSEHEVGNFNHLSADRFFVRARDPQQRATPLSTNARIPPVLGLYYQVAPGQLGNLGLQRPVAVPQVRGEAAPGASLSGRRLLLNSRQQP
jgi:hypothetical protein